MAAPVVHFLRLSNRKLRRRSEVGPRGPSPAVPGGSEEAGLEETCRRDISPEIRKSRGVLIGVVGRAVTERSIGGMPGL